QATGALEWTYALGVALSGPVILEATSPMVLVVQGDGWVKLASAAGVTPLLHAGAFNTEPPVPALEPSGSYGVAYVPDGAAWLWVITLPAPPMQASSTAWPRPGRDSCNSRSGGASCP